MCACLNFCVSIVDLFFLFVCLFVFFVGVGSTCMKCWRWIGKCILWYGWRARWRIMWIALSSQRCCLIDSKFHLFVLFTEVLVHYLRQASRPVCLSPMSSVTHPSHVFPPPRSSFFLYREWLNTCCMKVRWERNSFASFFFFKNCRIISLLLSCTVLGKETCSFLLFCLRCLLDCNSDYRNRCSNRWNNNRNCSRLPRLRHSTCWDANS